MKTIPNETWLREDEDAADGIPDDTAGALRMRGEGNSPFAPVVTVAAAANGGGAASGTRSKSGSARSSCWSDAIARVDIDDAKSGSGELQWPGSQSKRAADS